MSITVIGDIFVDIKGHPNGIFIPDGRNPGRMETVHGGVGRNAAEDLARIGVPVKFAALADFGGTGDDVIRRLNESGVDTSCMVRSENGMGTWMAIFNEKGDVAANISIRPELLPLKDVIIEKEKELFSDCDSIILEIDLEEETVERTFSLAGKYGKKVYSLVSVMSIALERRKYFHLTECFICNLQEAGMMFECDLEALDIPQLIAFLKENISRDGLSKLIVTLGEKGAVYVSSDGEEGYVPARKVTLIDSTGAGDSFCAASAAALTMGKALKDACVIGTNMAARVISSADNVCDFTDKKELGF